MKSRIFENFPLLGRPVRGSIAGLLLLALSGISCQRSPVSPEAETVPGHCLAETVAAAPVYPGKIAASEVPIRGLVPRPRDTNDPHDTLKAIRGFHATRLEWTYGLTPGFIREVNGMGVSASGASNPAMDTRAETDPDWIKARSILTLDLEPARAPWMRARVPVSLHRCDNNPVSREMNLAELKMQIDAGVRDIQRDDGAGNAIAVSWGACFCEHCMKGFRDYLKANVSSGKLAELGVENIDTFGYREFLIARGAPSGDAFRTYQGGELKTHFQDFQTRSAVEFDNWFRSELNKYAGRYVPMSANNAGQFFGPEFQPFDFWIGELEARRATPYFLFDLSQRVRSMEKGQILTMPLEQSAEMTPQWLRTIRNVIATTYATGMHMEAPWDTYLPTAKQHERYFGEPNDFADLYAMARASSALLDGYETAAATGASIQDDRWSPADQPVTVLSRSPHVAAFARSKPGDPDAPIAVHLVDWSNANKSFQISLRPELLFNGHPFRAFLITPKPYDQAEHDRAFDTKDYSRLINRTPLAEGRMATLDIPALSPWGIVSLEPMDESESMEPPVWSPAVSVQDSPAGLPTAVLTSASQNAEIRYSLDGSEPQIVYSDPGHSIPLSQSGPQTLRARAFADGKASRETKISLVPQPEKTALQLLKNSSFEGALTPWQTFVGKGIDPGELHVSADTFPSAPFTPAAKMFIQQGSATVSYQLRLGQPVKLPAATRVLFTGVLQSDRDTTVNVILEDRQDSHGKLFSKTVSLTANKPAKIRADGFNASGAREGLLLLDVGGAPAGTTIWLTQPQLEAIPLNE